MSKESPQTDGVAFQSQRLCDAFALALRLHGGQQRKGTSIPYIAHLMAVCAMVLEHGGDEDQAIAALLHDGPEDHGGRDTLELVRGRFGARVAGIVEACTDTFDDPKPAWRPRKEAYLQQLTQVDRDVLLVSLADKIHNLSSIVAHYREHGEKLWKRFAGKKEGTLWYYRSLRELFVNRHEDVPAPLLDLYRRAYSEIEHLVQP